MKLLKLLFLFSISIISTNLFSAAPTERETKAAAAAPIPKEAVLRNLTLVDSRIPQIPKVEQILIPADVTPDLRKFTEVVAKKFNTTPDSFRIFNLTLWGRINSSGQRHVGILQTDSDLADALAGSNVFTVYGP